MILISSPIRMKRPGHRLRWSGTPDAPPEQAGGSTNMFSINRIRMKTMRGLSFRENLPLVAIAEFLGGKGRTVGTARFPREANPAYGAR
jgi:hypothetical protein